MVWDQQTLCRIVAAGFLFFALRDAGVIPKRRRRRSGWQPN